MCFQFRSETLPVAQHLILREGLRNPLDRGCAPACSLPSPPTARQGHVCGPRVPEKKLTASKGVKREVFPE